ncbi:MAG: hypothetical protein JJ934_12020 [Pseudomonadales bacterium]|nr:hypothetical protein [Pseudomonadales bacterium]
MITVALFIFAYASVCLIVIVPLFRICTKIRNVNLRLLAKSACLAVFLTPTISVPATIPVPAVLQLLVGLIGLHPGLALVGLLPITVVTLAFFLLLKAMNFFRRPVNEEPSV